MILFLSVCLGGGNVKPTKNEKKSRFMDFDKGTTVRINMQTFGAGKWPSGSVGEYDAFGAPGISSRKRYVREQMQRLSPGT